MACYPSLVFGKRIDLFTILGFTVRLDLSWLLLAALVTFSSATGFQAPPGLFPVHVSWVMGAALAVGLFFSIVAHELTHSLVARLHGMRMKGITLFFLGGVAEMEDEPPTPWAEFTMAIVGPIASLVVAAILVGGFLVGRAASFPDSVQQVLQTMAVTNAVLAGFNMVPAFPLDGGRVLRAVLWGWRQDLLWATRIAGTLGAGFGALLILAGIVLIAIPPHPWQAITWILLGYFLMRIARLPYEQLVTRAALAGLTAGQFLETNAPLVPRWMPLGDFIEGFVYKQEQRVFPVSDGAALVGVVSADAVKRVPREEWLTRSVGELTAPMPEAWTTAEDEAAEQALERMARARVQQLFVVRDGQLAGVVRLSAILTYLDRRRELEGR